MSRAPFALLVVALASSGCYRFTITNGRVPAATPQSSYDDRLHSAIIGDIFIIDQPFRFDQICPAGWARIERRESAYDGLLDLVAHGSLVGQFYQADSVTVYCAALPPTPPPVAVVAPGALHGPPMIVVEPPPPQPPPPPPPPPPAPKVP